MTELDGAELRAGLQGRADLGKLEKDHVAQLCLGVVADADGCGGALDADPLVTGGESVGGEVGHVQAPLGRR